MFTKHVIREVANEGSLKWLIPIGMEVEASLTRKRLQDAISSDPDASVAETFPAPNAWIPGTTFRLIYRRRYEHASQRTLFKIFFLSFVVAIHS